MGQEVSKPPEGASGVPEAALNVSVPTAGEPAASNLSRSHSAHMLSHAVPPAVSDERHRRAHTWQHRGQQRRVYTRAPWPARGGSSTPGPSDTESEASVSESGGLSRTGSSNRVKRSISEASDCSELGEDRPRGPGHGDGHHGNSGTWPRMPKRSSSSSQLRHDRLDVWELTHALAREKSDLTSLLARMTSEAEARGDGGPAPPALNRRSSDDSTACDSQLWQLDALVAKERQRAEVDDGTLNSILGALQDQFKPEEPPSAAPVVLPKRAPAPRHTPPPPHPPPAAALYGLPHAPHPHVPRPHAPPPLMPHAPHTSSAHHHAHQQAPQDVPHYASYHAPRPPYEYEGNAYWYTRVPGAPAIGQHATLPVHGRAGGDPTSCVTLPPATGAVLGARKGAVLGACHGAALGACHGAVLGVCNGAVLGAYSHESAGSAAAGTFSRPQRMPPAVPLLPEAALGPQAFARSSSDHLGPSRTISDQLGPARTSSDHLGLSRTFSELRGAFGRSCSDGFAISDHLGPSRTSSDGFADQHDDAPMGDALMGAEQSSALHLSEQLSMYEGLFDDVDFCGDVAAASAGVTSPQLTSVALEKAQLGLSPLLEASPGGSGEGRELFPPLHAYAHYGALSSPQGRELFPPDAMRFLERETELPPLPPSHPAATPPHQRYRLLDPHGGPPRPTYHTAGLGGGGLVYPPGAPWMAAHDSRGVGIPVEVYRSAMVSDAGAVASDLSVTSDPAGVICAPLTTLARGGTPMPPGVPRGGSPACSTCSAGAGAGSSMSNFPSPSGAMHPSARLLGHHSGSSGEMGGGSVDGESALGGTKLKKEKTTDKDGPYRKEWTSVEDELIVEAVRELGPKWRQIASALQTGRSDDAVRNRYNRLMEPGVVINMWARENGSQSPKYKCSKCGQVKKNHICTYVKPEADGSQQEAYQQVEGSGVHPRAIGGVGGIGGPHGGAGGSECGSRASSSAGAFVGAFALGEQDKKDMTLRVGWTKAEDDIIINSVAELGNKWNLITPRLPGRTDHAIRNRHHRLLTMRQNLLLAASSASAAATDDIDDLLVSSEGHSSPIGGEDVLDAFIDQVELAQQ